MASIMKKALVTQKGHTVGHVNSYRYKTVPNGALCSADLDNYTIGEIFFAVNEETGETEKQVKQATQDTAERDAVLVITPEQRLNVGVINEPLSYFYNEKGERATCAIVEKGLTFQTSAYDGEFTIGGYATWNGKKFVPSAEVPTGLGFRVLEIEEDVNYTIDDEALIMLEVY